MKFFFFLFNIVMSLILTDNAVSSAQYTNPPLTMGDYILRSCIASVVLIRNHRKSQLPTLNTTKSNSIIPNGNSIHRRKALSDGNTQMVHRNTMWSVRDKTSADTPLRTLDIKKGRTRDLIFMKKDHFPEIVPSRYNDDIREKNARIIVIKSANRNSS